MTAITWLSRPRGNLGTRLETLRQLGAEVSRLTRKSIIDNLTHVVDNLLHRPVVRPQPISGADRSLGRTARRLHTPTAPFHRQTYP